MWSRSSIFILEVQSMLEEKIVGETGICEIKRLLNIKVYGFGF